mgnify:CR=1 FL=1
MINLIGYTRISNQQNTDVLKEDKEKLEKHCKNSKNYNLLNFYEEISDDSVEQPPLLFSTVLNNVQKADGLIIPSLDILSKSSFEIIKLFDDYFKNTDKEFISLDLMFLDLKTPQGTMILQFTAAQIEYNYSLQNMK